jgi:hypothetical protein
MTTRDPIAATVVFLSLLLAAAGGLTPASAASIEVPRISIEETQKILGRPDVVIIDVRTAKTWWRSGTKILHAVREEIGSVKQWADKYAKDQTLIFY